MWRMVTGMSKDELVTSVKTSFKSLMLFGNFSKSKFLKSTAASTETGLSEISRLDKYR